MYTYHWKKHTAAWGSYSTTLISEAAALGTLWPRFNDLKPHKSRNREPQFLYSCSQIPQ
jgi:hypothetical protein